MSKGHSKVGFLLDMDGLLINSEEVADRVFEEVCTRNGGSFSREIRMATIGTESWFWAEYITQHAELNLSAEEFKREFQEMYRKRLDEHIAFMPGAEDLLDWIEKKSYPRCLVTSAGRENTQRNLELLGISNYFNLRITAEDSPEGKPHPSPYLKGAELVGLKPKECIVFEDSIAGTLSGHHAGCKVFSVPTVFVDKGRLDMSDYILESLYDSISLLEALGL